jgi:hypothetical protein
MNELFKMNDIIWIFKNQIIDLLLSVREGYIKAYNAILVAICKFIKFAIYIPTRKNIDAAELINLILEYIIEISKYF